MAAVAALPEQQQAAQGFAGRLMPTASSSQQDTGSGDTSSSSATITANDFLTLLVTEMQNQDPTANTDPNEYINQLVQVNSLEQLIGINQTLTAALSPTTTTTNPSAQPDVRGDSSAPDASGAALSTGRAGSGPATASPAVVSGNLNAVASNPAATRVAHSLDGRESQSAAVPAAALH